MSALKELYREVILDHNRSPRNFRTMPGANRTVDAYNPLCGDHYIVYMNVEGEVIRDISFEGSGCAISKASASIMGTLVKGKTAAEVEEMFGLFHRLVKGEVDLSGNEEALGKLAVFAGVSEFPARVKCASLAWHAARAALDQKSAAVSTE